MKLSKKIAYAAGLATVYVGNAMAALPAEFETEVETAKEDLTTIGGIVLLVVLVVAGIKWLRRPVH